MDPLDGTTNFVHGYPFSCVSIALAVNKQPVVGVVFNPILKELFSAVKGKGATLNGSPIKVSGRTGGVGATAIFLFYAKKHMVRVEDTGRGKPHFARSTMQAVLISPQGSLVHISTT